jgi:uncharacterized protein DUF4238
VSVERGFYEIELDDSVLTLEPGLANLETNTSAIVKKLTIQKTVKLNEEERLILAAFLAVQFVRTREQRLRFEYMGKAVAQKLQEMAGPAADEFTKSIHPFDSKVFGLKSVLNAKEFVPHFLNKTWLLFETKSSHPFFTSDNPVTLYKDVDLGPRGNLGLAVRGIQIYVPISSTLCLALFCPGITTELQEHFEAVTAWSNVVPEFGVDRLKYPELTNAFYEGITRGVSIEVLEQNVTMINSLQVMSSSRFVYCERDCFDLVEQMIADHADHREGLKPIVS